MTDPAATAADPRTATLGPRTVRAPDVPPGLEWAQPGDGPGDGPAGAAAPTLAALRGRVVLVDLWTYGCINCQHVAPELAALEREFPGRLAVVGVHSGKFIAERVTGRIAHAAARLGVAHPVVNDRQFRLWRAWAARGWPTLALVDPAGYVVYQAAGERRAGELAPLVREALARAEAERGAAPGPLPWGLPAEPTPPAGVAPLRYPSAVAVGAADASGTRWCAVADAGHHRVLVGRLDRQGRTLRVTHVVGRGSRTRGVYPEYWSAIEATRTRDAFALLADGGPERATFDRPQGLAFAADGRTLYVADTGNHAVRAVDVASGRVRTLAGTGVRLRTRADRRAGALASPWGVLVAGRGDGDAEVLLVAMAGTHELWRLDPRSGAAGPVAGGRGEGLVDGAPVDALLAQPSALASDGRRVWWVDAEASAVREAMTAALGVWPAGGVSAEPSDGTSPVRTLVGTGLFDFGLRDGVGDAARLQHPQGLAWVPGRSGGGRLLVVDSYNDALRWLDPAERRVETWVDGFAEPSGVAVAGDVALVADTNAHRVAVVTAAGVDTLEVVDGRG